MNDGSDSDNMDETGQKRGNLQPYKFSGKNYSFDMHQEKIILGNLRLWAVNYLNENSVIHKSNYQLLKEVG